MEPHEDLEDSPYLALSEVGEDSRWAFGGGFDDPLEGVDTRVPDGLDAEALAAVCLALGDESLLVAQTLQRWCTRAPELEEEVALANIALDLLGQTRLLYARAAAAAPGRVPDLAEGSPVPPEDRLAFFREAHEFAVTPLSVMPDADFAALVLRLAAIATWRDGLWHELGSAPDPVLAAVAQRAVVEVAYHRDLAARWVVVLADGTEESTRRMHAAIGAVAPLVPSLTSPPQGADDSVWTESWRRAGDHLETAWRALLDQTGLGSGAITTESAPLDPWRADLVTELQSVAREHAGGLW